SINHFCMNLEQFDADRILKTLESYGIKPRESQTGPVGPMRHYISMRMENRGGAKDGTPELYFTDADGILVQIQDASYCGGAGVLGNVCPPVNGSVDILQSTRAFEQWMARQIPVVRKDLRLKHQQLAESAFFFLRGTFYRWMQRWPEVCADLADAPKLACVGDLHVENFGTWRDAEGRLVW